MEERWRIRLEVEELYAEYAACLDGDRLEHWPELFTDECVYKVMPRENFERGFPLALIYCESRGMLRDRAAALRKTSVYAPRSIRHMITGIQLVESAPETVRCEANFAVFETPRGGSTQILSVGRSFDRLERENGTLRFRERICVFDTEMVPGSLVFPL